MTNLTSALRIAAGVEIIIVDLKVKLIKGGYIVGLDRGVVVLSNKSNIINMNIIILLVAITY